MFSLFGAKEQKANPGKDPSRRYYLTLLTFV